MPPWMIIFAHNWQANAVQYIVAPSVLGLPASKTADSSASLNLSALELAVSGAKRVGTAAAAKLDLLMQGSNPSPLASLQNGAAVACWEADEPMKLLAEQSGWMLKRE